MVVNIERVIVTPKQMASRLIFPTMPTIAMSLVSPGKGSLTLNRVRLLISESDAVRVKPFEGEMMALRRSWLRAIHTTYRLPLGE